MCEYWNEAIKKIIACNTAEGPQEKRRVIQDNCDH